MKTWIAVACGGAVGACGRYALALIFASQPTKFPVATFVANGIGCFLMGLGFVFITERMLLPDPWKHLLLVGFLGALTTYSSFAIEAVNLITNQHYKIALTYIFATLALCLVAAFLGLSVAKQILN